jgi:hypothetical protein
MQANALYDDVVTDVLDELRLRIEAALEAGIPPGCLIVDPGLGFAKAPEHNWELLGRLGDVRAPGPPSSWARHASRSWAICSRTRRRGNRARHGCVMPRRPPCPYSLPRRASGVCGCTM